MAADGRVGRLDASIASEPDDGIANVVGKKFNTVTGADHHVGAVTEQPAAAFLATKLILDGGGISLAVVPKPAVDQAHQVGVLAADGPGLVWRD